MAVYPRAYGERPFFISSYISNTGLSPCLRGTHSQLHLYYSCERFIPVLTGNAFATLHTSTRCSVYPRAYGERTQRHQVMLRRHGLSPCLRGTLAKTVEEAIQKRFIPVLTGNAQIAAPSSKNLPGLSPCLRGTPVPLAVAAYPCRFIPVLTGNAYRCALVSTRRAVYPRAYGERASHFASQSATAGLSPCLRGTHQL